MMSSSIALIRFYCNFILLKKKIISQNKSCIIVCEFYGLIFLLFLLSYLENLSINKLINIKCLITGKCEPFFVCLFGLELLKYLGMETRSSIWVFGIDLPKYLDIHKYTLSMVTFPMVFHLMMILKILALNYSI